MDNIERENFMSDYKKLESLCREIDELIAKNVTVSSPEFKVWKAKTERFLIQKFGKNSFEHNDFIEQEFSVPFFSMNTSHDSYVLACRNGLVIRKEIFGSYLYSR